MIKVSFPACVNDDEIRFSVIVAKKGDRWLFCRHNERNTLECPGGHREPGETPEETARRELYEETGAIEYTLQQIGAYRVTRFGGGSSCGMLYRAEVSTLGKLPEGSEIAEVRLLGELPENWTYPDIQPHLLKKAWPETLTFPLAHHHTAAYVMGRRGLCFRDEDAPMLDQLNYAFALVKDGRVSGDHWQHIDAYKAFIARHPHILPVVSVGGWGAGGFSEAAATEEGRQLFVSSALTLMEEHGFLGLDMDWEYPGSDAAGIAASPNDRENFTLLLEALRSGLDALTARDGKHRLLAAALGASSQLVKHIECIKVGKLLDQVNLMTYDMYQSGKCCHHTALFAGTDTEAYSAQRAVQDYVAAGIPAEKIMLGCAFYARVYEHDGSRMPPVNAPSPSNGGDTMPYDRIVADEALTHAFDEAASAAYAYDGKRYLTHDSPISIFRKRAYVHANGLMGLMCWEYGEDHEGELLRAMHG